MVKNVPSMRDTNIQSLGQEEPLEKGTTKTFRFSESVSHSVMSNSL